MSTGTADETDESTYVDSRYLIPGVVEDREYQSILVENALKESSLIALPTGTGKTPVALRIAAERLDNPGGKVLLLAPTQPLVEQHTTFFREALDIPDHEIKIFNGDISPDDREEEWGRASVIIATPQVIENDLVGNRYTLEDVSYIVFDECHRATGDYSYVYIGERYHGNAENPLATGLSASPGSSKDDILNVCTNLGLTNVEVFTEDDEKLAEHTHETTVDYKEVELPEEIEEARDMLQDEYKEKLVALKKDFGVISSAKKDLSRKRLLNARGKIQRLIDNDDSKGYKAMSVHAEAMKIEQGFRTLESHSVGAARKYFDRIVTAAENNDSKAAQRIASSTRINRALDILESYDGQHPKLQKLHTELAYTLGIEDGQAIVFTDSRDTVNTIIEFLEQKENINPARFVGQNDRENDPGMTQTEQKEVVEQFRNGEHDVLISTSVGEEGIDLPSIDLVMFYEPVPTAIRSVQRAGRTGRDDDGRVVVLMAKGTIDESKYWISQNREQQMETEMENLKEMEGELVDELREQQASLADFGNRDLSDDRATVICDSRETQSNITKQLDRMADVQVELETLDVGDYVLSNNVAVERKEHEDLISTLTDDRSIFEQIKDLASSYADPVLVLEGGTIDELYGKAQVSEEALRGTLASISTDYGVSVICTSDEEETGKLLRTFARREQEESDGEVSAHGEKSTQTDADEQQYIVSSVADVGPVIAKNLLEHFGSVQAVFTADREDLTEVEKVGEATATHIYSIVREEFDPTE